MDGLWFVVCVYSIVGMRFPSIGRFVRLAVAIGMVAAGLVLSGASNAWAQTVADVEVRDRLIADQEALLNVYRCIYDVDTEVVPGGCEEGMPALPAEEPQPFTGTSTYAEIAVRDELVAEQEFLLNSYRCQFDIDTQVVPGGCVAFEAQRARIQFAALVEAGINERRGGLSPLALDDRVTAAAQARAQTQAQADDWVYDFDYRSWLEPNWGTWVVIRSVRWSAGIVGPRLESISRHLLDFDQKEVQKLRCEWCTHLGVGFAEHGGRIYATLLLAAALPSESTIAAAENEVIVLVNQLRTGLGLGTLSSHEDVAAVARRWSQTMADKQQFEHNPSYSRQYPSGWTKASENIAMVPLSKSISEAARYSYRILENSPGHYANMTDPDLTHIGVGIHVRGNGLWVTQNFATYPATTTTNPGPQTEVGSRAVTLRQTDVDAVYEQEECNVSCTWQAVTVTGFEPGTYAVGCWSLNTPDNTPLEYQIYIRYTVSVGPDGTGSNTKVCWNGWYEDVAEHSADVYVTVGNIKSNTITLRRP